MSNTIAAFKAQQIERYEARQEKTGREVFIYRTPPGQEHRAAAECRRERIKVALPRFKMRRPAFGRSSSPLASGYIFTERRPENARFIHGGPALGTITRQAVSALWAHCRIKKPSRPENPFKPGDRVIIAKGHLAEVSAVVRETRLRTCLVAYEMLGKTHQQAIGYAQLRPG